MTKFLQIYIFHQNHEIIDHQRQPKCDTQLTTYEHENHLSRKENGTYYTVKCNLDSFLHISVDF